MSVSFNTSLADIPKEYTLELVIRIEIEIYVLIEIFALIRSLAVHSPGGAAYFASSLFLSPYRNARTM